MRDQLSPPKLFLRFFRWYCHPKMQDYIEGDLMEMYERRLKESGKRKADLRFVADVLLLFRPGIIRPTEGYHYLNNYGMIGNYLKIAWRNLHRQWQYNFINVMGLGVAMACSIFVTLFVHDERRYDRYHEGADRIYRVVRDEINNAGESVPEATTPRAMAFSLRTDLPEVESAATLFQCRQMVFQYHEKQFYESRVYETDSNLFRVFAFRFVKGSPLGALSGPQSAIITQSTAEKYFGTEDPIGKQLQTENAHYFVEGVLEDVPRHSHFKFDILIPMRTIETRFNTIWGPPNFYTYIRVRKHTDPITFERKLATYASAKYERQPLDKFHIQALTDIHLRSKLKGELEANGDESVIRIIIAIGLFIIFMAGINYINLATARSARRAKEVGIRKTSGAMQSGLIFQFLIESALVALSAFLLAIILCNLLINSFNQLMDKQLQLSQPELWPVWFSLAGLAITVGLVAGLYPAIYLSSFNPVKVLKGNTGMAKGGALRKSLVTLQFSISISLIIGTIVVIAQMNYIDSKDPGFDKDQVIVVPNANRLPNRHVLEQHIANLSGVKKVGASTGTVSGAANWTGNIRAEGSDTDKMIHFCQINYDYIDALGIRLLEGRQFSRAFPSDTVNALILNETAVRELNLTDPVGKRLVWDQGSLDTLIYAPVIGVVSDFHFAAFHEPIKPFAFLIRNTFFVQFDFTSKLFIKTTGNPGTVQQIEELWKEFVPQRPFTYTYLDDNFRSLHAEEERFKALFTCLTGLGIFIICLGLFALISFVTEQRTKEIGIRKILGASVASIVLMINNDFMKLVLVALAIASPVSYSLMDNWLDGFAYKISLEWWMFVLAFIIAWAIVVITTGYQSVKASTSNPIDSLRTE